MANTRILENVTSTVYSSTRKCEQFLSAQDDVALKLKESTKCLYDYTKEQSQRNSTALPELVTEGFDEEQIWQQLELQNESELEYLLNNIGKILAVHKHFVLPITLAKDSEACNESSNLVVNKTSSEEDISLNGPTVAEKDLNNKDVHIKKSKKRKSSVVDDKFFKLQELDEYLTKEERREKLVGKSTEESDDESIDLFEDLSGNENEEDGENAKFLKYADFFDIPESEEDIDDRKSSVDTNNVCNDPEENSEYSLPELDLFSMGLAECDSSTKRVKFNLTNDSDETDSVENKVAQKMGESEAKSSLEIRQERLLNKIKQMEDEALSEKPWQLKGEVNATDRPQNSLLEEFVEFDITSRPAPVITEQTTLKLEDIIKQRIKDKTWDDVEKKFKPVETPLEYKKKLILDQEKSKESLSQIYENEYLKQKKALNPDTEEQEAEEPKLHIEIKEMMHSLLSKLNALSNFHYTPKMAKPEIKIISNISAINMEEVAPVTTSEATLLAPEEVKAKSHSELKAKEERTKTDKKRERRMKKLRQRERRKHVEKKEWANSSSQVDKKRNKNEERGLLKKLTKDRNISKLAEASDKITKSSTAFFNQLQDEVKNQIKSKVNTQAKKRNQNTLSAIKLKL